MTQFRTTAVYLSGAICGHMWMPAAMAGKPLNANARGHWGFWDRGDNFRDALYSLLCKEGGDFQDSQFTADTVLRIERRAIDAPGKYRVHVKEIEISKLPDCADLVNADHYVGDFMGDYE